MYGSILTLGYVRIPQVTKTKGEAGLDAHFFELGPTTITKVKEV